MHLSSTQLRKFTTALTIGVLMVSFAYAPASPALAPKPVEAQWAVIDPANLIQTTFSAIANVAAEANTWYLQWKESVGDGIAWNLIDMVIQQMIRDTTAWVSSGFQGKPAFVQNLGKYLGNIADEFVGDYIWDSDALNFLCSPFQLNIKYALDLQYAGPNGMRDYHRSQCSLSGSLANVQGSLGTFMSQGWDNWFQVTLNNENNPYGAYFDAEEGLVAGIQTTRTNQNKMLDFGNGFLSLKDENGNIITPGNVIQTQLNDALNVPRERLAVADEINELFGALITQLLRGVLSSDGGGLMGLGGGSNDDDGVFNSPDYASSTSGIGAGMSRQFEADRSQEERYLALANQGISIIDGALKQQGCDAELRQQLSTRRGAMAQEAAEALANLGKVAEYEARLNATGTSVNDVQQIVQEYVDQVRPTFHTIHEMAEVEAALAQPPSQEDDVLTTTAAAGNIRSLAMLYEKSCK